MINLTKRGQVTIFVIVAIVLVALVVAIFYLVPGVRETVTQEEFTPNNFLKSCVQDEIDQGRERLSNQGSSLDFEGTVMYQGEEYKYLCYTSEYYQTCTRQMSNIKTNFEKSLNEIANKRANECYALLKEEYGSRGFDVSAGQTESRVEVKPRNIRVSFDTPLTVTKEETRTFNGFNIEIESQMYELLYIAQSIIDFESTFGDTDTSLYYQYYPNLKIEKTKLGDGTTIYKLSNVVTEEEFKFASRSLAWPPGYGA